MKYVLSPLARTIDITRLRLVPLWNSLPARAAILTNFAWRLLPPRNTKHYFVMHRHMISELPMQGTAVI